MNLYAYVGNSPVDLVDPLGLFDEYYPYSPEETVGGVFEEAFRPLEGPAKKAEYIGRKALSLGAQELSWEYELRKHLAFAVSTVPSTDIPHPYISVLASMFGATSDFYYDLSEAYGDWAEELDPDRKCQRN